jgi:hypothetical protein
MTMASSVTPDALETLGGSGFDTLYARQIEPELTLREADRRKAMNLFALAVTAGVVAAAIEAIFLPSMGGGAGARTLEIILLTLTVAGVVGYLPLARVAKAAKVDVMNALCAPFGIAYQASGFEPPAWSQFLSLHLLPTPSGKSFEDHFAGLHAARPFEVCEATLSQGSGRSRHTVFRGQLFKIKFPRIFGGVTVILRDSGWLNRFECPAGLTKVGLEDPHFEAIFEVFGSDQVEARAILTPTFMEQILKLEAAYAGEHIRCGFIDGDLLIAIEGRNRFEIGSMFSSLVDRARVEAIAGDLTAVFTLIDSFTA